jgi:hypothetical protein
MAGGHTFRISFTCTFIIDFLYFLQKLCSLPNAKQKRFCWLRLLQFVNLWRYTMGFHKSGTPTIRFFVKNKWPVAIPLEYRSRAYLLLTSCTFYWNFAASQMQSKKSRNIWSRVTFPDTPLKFEGGGGGGTGGGRP